MAIPPPVILFAIERTEISHAALTSPGRLNDLTNIDNVTTITSFPQTPAFERRPFQPHNRRDGLGLVI
jgi:hypothetical protein